MLPRWPPYVSPPAAICFPAGCHMQASRPPYASPLAAICKPASCHMQARTNNRKTSYKHLFQSQSEAKAVENRSAFFLTTAKLHTGNKIKKRGSKTEENLRCEKKRRVKISFIEVFSLPLHSLSARNPIYTGKSPTASSLGIPQDGNVARVLGCSGAIRIACPPASLAQLARARDL